MKNEVPCKFLCHNIQMVHQSIIEPEIDGEFWKGEPADGPRRLSRSPERS